MDTTTRDFYFIIFSRCAKQSTCHDIACLGGWRTSRCNTRTSGKVGDYHAPPSWLIFRSSNLFLFFLLLSRRFVCYKRREETEVTGLKGVKWEGRRFFFSFCEEKNSSFIFAASHTTRIGKRVSTAAAVSLFFFFFLLPAGVASYQFQQQQQHQDW